jgi:serine/threonine-protein kinase
MRIALQGGMRGKIHLQNLLGEGGMGRVFSAHHEGMGCDVAIKVLGPAFGVHFQARERFLREARIAARVSTPHAVRVLDHACTGLVPYIVFEKVEGEDLASWLHHRGPLSPHKLVTVVRQLASAIDAVHAAGVVHCDVKLANAMVSENDGTIEAKLIDFGVARALDEKPLDGDDSPSGTIYAMSPEQILKPDEAAPHWDLWGLAVLAFTALNGRAPFQGKSIIGVLGAALQGQREPIDTRLLLGGRVAEVFDRAFSIALQERFATATEFAEAFAAALEPALDDADAVLDRIAASMNEHDPVTAVRQRAEMMTTRVRPRGDERAVPDARRKAWINEKDSERSTSISKKFGAGRALMSKTAPSRPRIAATAVR